MNTGCPDVLLIQTRRRTVGLSDCTCCRGSERCPINCLIYFSENKPQMSLRLTHPFPGETITFLVKITFIFVKCKTYGDNSDVPFPTEILVYPTDESLSFYSDVSPFCTVLSWLLDRTRGIYNQYMLLRASDFTSSSTTHLTHDTNTFPSFSTI